ncbi:hypothetical protein NNO_0077 [Hydrogenimonas sp.]|nr:hypothetical protein NNO_0077 [Hydrogenimonas sp.]
MKREFTKIVSLLKKEYESWDAPAKEIRKRLQKEPFTVMVSVFLSFRTKDEVTLEAGKDSSLLQTDLKNVGAG